MEPPSYTLYGRATYSGVTVPPRGVLCVQVLTPAVEKYGRMTWAALNRNDGNSSQGCKERVAEALAWNVCKVVEPKMVRRLRKLSSLEGWTSPVMETCGAGDQEG